MHKNQFLFAFIFNFNLTSFIVKSNKQKANKKRNKKSELTLVRSQNKEEKF